LYSTSRLLDDYEHNRSYWILGTGDISRTPVAFPWIIRKDMAVPFGLMMAFDDKTVWAVRRSDTKKKTAEAAMSVSATPRPNPSKTENHVPDFQKRTAHKSEDTGFSWKTNTTKGIRAILCAVDTLVIAGGDNESGFLQSLSARKGTLLDEQQLKSPPVWDGLAATTGRLYVALENGTVVCLDGKTR
jgi:hypothetical protein